MHLLQDFSVANIHMNSARQAGIETSHRPHNVDGKVLKQMHTPSALAGLVKEKLQ
jgi:hypothetical protein